MTEAAKKIIADTNAVIRCLDPALSSHETFLASELLKVIMKKSASIIISEEELWNVFNNARNVGNYSATQFRRQVIKLITQESSTLINTLIEDGKDCSFLQPDGKGWQKGKIKLCFEFIPEEAEVGETVYKHEEIDRSPLDEIRNSLVVESN
jgi:KGK domain